jgi:hypothetical protein
MDEGREPGGVGGPPPAETVAVTGTDELEPSRGGRRRRRRGLVAVALVAVTAIVGVTAAIALSADDGDDHRVTSTDLDSPAAQRVFAALGTTTAAGSFTATYEVRTEPATHPRVEDACRPAPVPNGGGAVGQVCVLKAGGAASPVTITGVATINQDPYRMRSVSEVTGFGQITTIVDGTRLWEMGGGDYGMHGRSGDAAPGDSISGFAGLVEGTLGRGPGALTMLTLASPNGYLNLSKEAVTRAAPAGTGTVGGIAVTYFDVDVRPDQLLGVAGLTGEQTKTIREALATLADAGYQGTTTRVAIDADGLIRETSSVARFEDGSKQTSRTTFSDFGCAGIVSLPGEPDAPEPTGPCPDPTASTAVPATAPTPASTVRPGASPTTVVPDPSTTTTTGAPSGTSGSGTTATSTTTTTGPGEDG